MVEQLTPDERARALDALGDWDFDEARDGIVRQFLFEDFSQAFGFMTRVAPQMNIFSIGFTITIFMGFAVLLVSLPTIGNGMSSLLQTVSSIVRDLILGKGVPA